MLFRSFKRLLNSLINFDDLSPEHEVIIIDNNSIPSLEHLELVQNFLNFKSESTLVRESKSGLTAARIAGIKNAKYNWLIFFDDDNEPEADYLTSAADIINIHPQVGVWGPGVVNVEYIGKANKWFQDNKRYFQQRNALQVDFALQLH